jgi:uncharacterized surface protein with fasciclin (FAS1) repeats
VCHEEFHSRIVGWIDRALARNSCDRPRIPWSAGGRCSPKRTSFQNAVNSADHTTLVAAVKAAGLVQTLEGPGPLTVFAPTKSVFNKLPAGTVQTLLKPENKAELVEALTYHLVPGRLTTFDLKEADRGRRRSGDAQDRER